MACPYQYHDCYHPERPISARRAYPRVDIGRGMITVLVWKKASIILFIANFNIEIKTTRLTSHTDIKRIWI
jgi:hypothetical protein